MNYIDIHTHKLNQDLEESLQIRVKDFALGERIENEFEAIGIHPWSINSQTPITIIEQLENHIKQTTPWMLGEIGLDKCITTPLTTQIQFFKAQLRIAQEYKVKKVVIHSVKAYSEVLEILKQEKLDASILLHDFNSTIQMAQHYLKHFKVYFSFGEKLFQPQTKAHKCFQKLPIDKILLETDDSPLNIQKVYKQAAQLRKMDETELKNQLFSNFNEFNR